MSLSLQQKRLVDLLHNGHQLRIVRSLLDRSRVYAEVLSPETLIAVECVQWWRVTRLLRTRSVRLDTGDLATATHLVPTRQRRARTPRYSLTAPVMPDT